MTELVLGPPGTGKTTTLLDEVEAELARGTPPDRIGYVSFTKRAAEEAASRAAARFSLDRDQLPYFRTLHSLCFRHLGLSSGDVLEGARLQEFATAAQVKISGRISQDGTTTGFDFGDRVVFMENLSRVRCISLREQYELDNDGQPWNRVKNTADALREFKKARGLLDYTDMLAEFVRLGHGAGLEVLFVDEAQDLSQLQWRVIAVLARGARRVVIAGDDDQAIYRWAGADVEHLINMDGDARVLGQSYRVPPAMQAIAAGLIGGVLRRRPKVWKAREGEEGEVRRVEAFADVDCEGPSVLVLSRNTYVLREQVEPLLRKAGIIYERDGHPSIKGALLAAIEAWEELRAGRTVQVRVARQAYEYLSTGSGVARGFKKLPGFADEDEVTIGDLNERGGLRTNLIWHEALERLPVDEMSYILAARRRGEKLRARPRVRLSTIHGSKGGEADHVVVMKEVASRTHREIEWAPEDERRVWYVAVTRAKHQLTIVESQTHRDCPWL